MTDVWIIPAGISLIALMFYIYWTLNEIIRIKKEKEDGINN